MRGNSDDWCLAVSERLSLRLESRLSSLEELEESVEQFGTQQGWPAHLLFQLQLALEELACNVINHGFGEEGHQFEISISSSPDSVAVEVVDGARPYNPLAQTPQPDLDADLEDRRVGGLGVYLVREMSDEIHYRREDGKNRLTFVKRRT